jgi:predicted O-linked N-acetylglucosamine transferase (SPINDLY family)
MLDAILSLAVRHHRAGQLAEAEALYGQARGLAPWRVEPHYLGAAAALGRGDARGARRLAEAACALAPADADCLALAARARAALGDAGAAEATLRRAVRAAPAEPGLRTELGALLQDRGDAEGAAAEYARAAEAVPDAAAFLNLGSALRQAGRAEDAVAALRRGLALAPWDADLWFNLGNALHALGRAEEAAEAFRAALARGAGAPAWTNLGAALAARRRPAEAAAALRRALALAPSDALAWTNLADAEQDRGRFEAALAHLRRAHRARPDPGLAVKLATALPVVPDSTEAIRAARERLAEGLDHLSRDGIRLSDPLREVGRTAFYLSYHGLDDRPLQERIARFYLGACPELGWTAPHCRGPARPRGRRIRVALVSENFHAHTIGKLNLGLVRGLDRARFEVVLVTVPRAPDPLRDALARAADRVVEIPLDLAGARERIAAVEADVLYYADVGMSALTYFLGFARLAPVQCATWGHPDTTGIPNMDWFATCDAMEPPGAEAHYAERLARLPGPTVRYERPAPPPPRARADLGLPGRGALYVCPQSLFKIHPDFDRALVEILARDPEGTLVLVNTQDRAVADRLRARVAAVAGLDPGDRLRFLGPLAQGDFLSLLSLADAMLDPFHYSGGNTSLEAFALGTPIVTWPGAFMRGRHTHGLYRLMGWDGLVARDHADYVRLALELGRDPDARAAARREILARAPLLFDHAPSIDAVGDFLEAAWREAAARDGAR